MDKEKEPKYQEIIVRKIEDGRPADDPLFILSILRTADTPDYYHTLATAKHLEELATQCTKAAAGADGFTIDNYHEHVQLVDAGNFVVKEHGEADTTT